jgi:DNA-binding IclR family transcriptional regulator
MHGPPVAVKERDGRSVTSRVFSVLDAFHDGRIHLSLSEISRRAGMPMATAHRLIRELVVWGALERDEHGRYQIGLRLWEVAALAPRGPGLREVAMPHVEELFEATRQHVQLAVLDGPDVVYVERRSARGAVRLLGRVGGRRPAHTTGVGLVLLAFAPGEAQQAYLARPLVGFTDRTIVDPDRLRRVLADVRRTGIAISDRQVSLDTMSVAAPIRNPDGQVVAALSVVARAPGTQPGALVTPVLASAQAISRSLCRMEQGAR